MASFFRRLKRMAGKEKGRVQDVKDEPAAQGPVSNTTTVHDDSSILSQCDCYDSVEEILDLIYNAPHFASMETKEPGLEYITFLLDLLEKLSLCDKNCSNADDYRGFMWSLCNSVLEQCQFFYQSLSDLYDMEYQHPLREGELDTVEEQEDETRLLCLHAYLQMKRLYNCVSRIIETLQQKPVFDEDAWGLVRSTTYRLAICTASLGSKTD
ncbi:hypothetical protein BBP40_007418 [Aspergillus hancockii]|nr:hypothetical protein BBP40_007418 [Aspergillus hancockii]